MAKTHRSDPYNKLTESIYIELILVDLIHTNPGIFLHKFYNYNMI